MRYEFGVNQLEMSIDEKHAIIDAFVLSEMQRPASSCPGRQPTEKSSEEEEQGKIRLGLLEMSGKV